MKKGFTIVLLFFFCAYLIQCNDDSVDPTKPPTPPPTTFKISNLIYDPKEVPIEHNTTTFSISGSVQFTNAQHGVAKLRLTSSAGNDLTVTLDKNSEPNGNVYGNFLFTMPSSPITYTFDIWLIDGKGNASNKLSGTIQLVPDDRLIYWEKIILSNTTWRMNRVIWADSKFIAIGYEGIILTSEDATQWISQPSGTTNLLSGIVWSGNQFVVVGENNTILTSPDGLTWTVQSSGTSEDIELLGVSWSGNIFVAVGRDSTQNETEILTSPDGINWTKNSFTVSGGELKSVAWSGTQFMAVGNTTTDPCCRTPKCLCGFYPLMITSPNGNDWTNRSKEATGLSGLHSIIWDGSKFVVAAGYSGLATIDGTTWNYENNICEYLRRIIRTEKIYVGIGTSACADADEIFGSSNGVYWYNSGLAFNLHIPNGTLLDVAWSGEKCVVVGYEGAVLVSPP